MVAITTKGIFNAATTVHQYTTSTVLPGYPCQTGLEFRLRNPVQDLKGIVGNIGKPPTPAIALHTVCETKTPTVTVTSYATPGGECTETGKKTAKTVLKGPSDGYGNIIQTIIEDFLPFEIGGKQTRVVTSYQGQKTQVVCVTTTPSYGGQQPRVTTTTTTHYAVSQPPKETSAKYATTQPPKESSSKHAAPEPSKKATTEYVPPESSKKTTTTEYVFPQPSQKTSSKETSKPVVSHPAKETSTKHDAPQPPKTSTVHSDVSKSSVTYVAPKLATTTATYVIPGPSTSTFTAYNSDVVRQVVSYYSQYGKDGPVGSETYYTTISYYQPPSTQVETTQVQEPTYQAPKPTSERTSHDTNSKNSTFVSDPSTNGGPQTPKEKSTVYHAPASSSSRHPQQTSATEKPKTTSSIPKQETRGHSAHSGSKPVTTSVVYQPPKEKTTSSRLESTYEGSKPPKDTNTVPQTTSKSSTFVSQLSQTGSHSTHDSSQPTHGSSQPLQGTSAVHTSTHQGYSHSKDTEIVQSTSEHSGPSKTVTTTSYGLHPAPSSASTKKPITTETTKPTSGYSSISSHVRTTQMKSTSSKHHVSPSGDPLSKTKTKPSYGYPPISESGAASTVKPTYAPMPTSAETSIKTEHTSTLISSAKKTSVTTHPTEAPVSSAGNTQTTGYSGPPIYSKTTESTKMTTSTTKKKGEPTTRQASHSLEPPTSTYRGGQSSTTTQEDYQPGPTTSGGHRGTTAKGQSPACSSCDSEMSMTDAKPSSPSSTHGSHPPQTTDLCPDQDGQRYKDQESGKDFTIECGIDRFGADFGGPHWPGSFAACIAVCAADPECVDVSWKGDACYLKGNLTDQVIDHESWGARVVDDSHSSSTVEQLYLITTSQKPGPSKTAESSPPHGYTSKTEPAGYTSKTSPTGHTSKTELAGQTSRTTPVVHISKMESAGHTSKTEPTGHTSKTGPTGHISKTEPADYTSKTVPTGRTSKTDTSGHTLKTEAASHTSKTDPTGHTSETEPVGHTSKVKEPTDKTSGYPQQSTTDHPQHSPTTDQHGPSKTTDYPSSPTATDYTYVPPGYERNSTTTTTVTRPSLKPVPSNTAAPHSTTSGEPTKPSSPGVSPGSSSGVSSHTQPGKTYPGGTMTVTSTVPPSAVVTNNGATTRLAATDCALLNVIVSDTVTSTKTVVPAQSGVPGVNGEGDLLEVSKCWKEGEQGVTQTTITKTLVRHPTSTQHPTTLATTTKPTEPASQPSKQTEPSSLPPKQTGSSSLTPEKTGSSSQPPKKTRSSSLPPVRTESSSQPPRKTESSAPPQQTGDIFDPGNPGGEKCSGTLNHAGKLFRLRTHVVSGAGSIEFENLYVQATEYNTTNSVPVLGSSRDSAGRFFYDGSTSSIAIWHGKCRFSGLTMYGDRDLDAYSPAFINNDAGTHRMRAGWGSVWWDNDRFDGWVVCRKGADSGYELKWHDAISNLGVDTAKCAKVELLTENL